MKRLVLDTSGYSALLRGDSNISDLLNAAEWVGLPVFVIGELHAGFCGGSRLNENLTLLTEFINLPTVHTLHTTDQTAQLFGTIKHTLRTGGTPIPINDIWIAAQTIESNAIIVTFDRHFDAVPNLSIWMPSDH